MSTLAPCPRRATPAQSPPREPPATTTRKSLRLSPVMGRRCLTQARGHVFWFHRAGEQLFTIEDESRHTRDSTHLRGLCFEMDFLGSGSAFKKSSNDGVGQARLFCNFGQHVCVADITALDEVGAEQRFDDSVLHAFFTGKP